MHIIQQLKDAEQDFEFYPTTNEIIAALIRDIQDGRYSSYNQPTSMLDIGAGNGKVLEAVRDAQIGVHTLYAIERSAILRDRLHHDVFVIGTDFHQQSLMAKNVGLIFCNPPYSEFEAWAVKIIRECVAPTAYLVIPQRWERSIPIQDALAFRRTTAEIIGTFDFEDAEDRAARAKVHLLRIDFRHRDDAFECFFREQFGELIQKFEEPAKSDARDADAPHGGRRRPFHGLVAGPDYPDRMVELYHLEMANIQRNYQLVSELDADLLREFEVTPDRIMTLLRQRLTNLRTEYWHELFGRMRPITERLTSRTRKALLHTLNRNASVDFTVSNIHAVIVWAIKNANRYIEEQLIETYELMVNKANVVLYKSNQRVFVEERWRYREDESQNSHYALDYRIVTHRVGGIHTSSYSWEQQAGLTQRACDFLGDLITIANNLGFLSSPDVPHLNGTGDRWVSGKPRTFTYVTTQGDHEILFEARAFQNGNIHLRLAKKFALALNVEFGRLKGWLRDAGEAATELNDPEAAKFFNTTLRLGGGNNALLLA
jgi:hypothetical protein